MAVVRNRVRELRALIGKGELSQKELAERAGIDPSTLSDIENNRTNPSGETLVLLARALGVALDALFLPEDTDGLSVDSALTAAAPAPSSRSLAPMPGDRATDGGGVAKDGAGK